jgi:hypothetical protein
MKRLLQLAGGALLVVLGSIAAHAQRYDSSYGYEMRGFIPPSPFPRTLEERRERGHEPDSIRERDRSRDAQRRRIER